MVVERSLVAPQPCYSSSASVFHDHERRGGGKRRKLENALSSSDCYFAALEFTEWGEDGEITESDGLLSYRGMIPYGDITHPTDQQFLDRYFYRGGKGRHARNPIPFSYSSSFFFLDRTKRLERQTSSPIYLFSKLSVGAQ